MTPEAKITEKIRKLVISDATLIGKGFGSKSVYASHISSIVQPNNPCLSIFILSSSVNFPLDTVIKIRLQIDAWFASDRFTTADIFECMERLRALLNQQNLTDTDLDLLSYSSREIENGPLLYEEDTQLFHLPSIYEMVVS